MDGPGAAFPGGSHLRVVLRDVETVAHVGLNPWERHTERPTRLLVNVEMFAPLTESPRAITPDDIVDYDAVCQAISAWPGRPHTDLLETLVAELVDLAFGFPRVSACRVSVAKPDIFNNAAAACVEASVTRADHERWRG